MTFIFKDKITNFGNDIKDMVAVNTTDSALGNATPAVFGTFESLSNFNKALGGTANNVQFLLNGTERTAKTAAVSGVVAAQAYLDALGKNLEADIQLTITENADIAGSTLTIQGFSGAGKLTVNYTGSSSFKCLAVLACSANIVCSGFKTVTGATIEATAQIHVYKSPNAEITEHVFGNMATSTACLYADSNSVVSFSGSMSGATVDTVFCAVNNSKIIVKKLTQNTGTINGYIYYATTRSIIYKPDITAITSQYDIPVVSDYSKYEKVESGSQIFGLYASSEKQGSATITIQEDFAGRLSGVINMIGRFIPAGATVTVNLPNITSTVIDALGFDFSGYHGGGGIVFNGTGSGTTELKFGTGGTEAVCNIKQNNIPILFSNLRIMGFVSCSDNLRVTFSTVIFGNTNSGTDKNVIVNLESGNYYLTACNINAKSTTTGISCSQANAYLDTIADVSGQEPATNSLVVNYNSTVTYKNCTFSKTVSATNGGQRRYYSGGNWISSMS